MAARTARLGRCAAAHHRRLTICSSPRRVAASRLARHPTSRSAAHGPAVAQGRLPLKTAGEGLERPAGRGISSCLAEDPPLAPCDTLHSRRHHPSTTYDHPVNGPTEARHRRRFVLKPSRPSAPASAWARRAMSDPYRWDVQVSRATSSRFTARGSSSRREAPPRPSSNARCSLPFPRRRPRCPHSSQRRSQRMCFRHVQQTRRSRSCAHLSAQQPRPRMRAASLRLQEGSSLMPGCASPSPHLVVSSTPFMTFAPWLAPRLPGRLRRLTLRAASRWRACTRRNVL